MADVNDNATKTVVLAARVPADYADEYELIRKHRSDEHMSDTVRAALDDFRIRHWKNRLPTEGAA